MKKIILNVLKYVIGLGLGLLLLYLASLNVDLDSLKNNLENANYGWVLLSLIAALFANVFRSFRWNMLLEAAGHKANFWNAFAAVIITYLVNLAIPRGGEVARCTMIYRTDNVPVPTSLGTVIVERVIDVICLAILLLFFTVVEFEKVSAFLGKAADAMSSNGGGGSTPIILVAVVGVIAVTLVMFFVFKEKIKTSPLFIKVADFTRRLIDAAKSVFKLKNKGLFFFHTFMIWACYAIMTYLPFLALDASSGLSFYFAIVVLVAGGLGMVFPSPGGIGSYEVAVMAVFVVFLGETMGVGPANELGSSIAIIIHLSQMVMIVLIGFLAFLFLLMRSLPTSKKA